MKRSVFFIIIAVIGALFGLMMFLGSRLAAQAFGITGSADTDTIFRVFGATLLGISVLNFMVRDHPASETLKAVLWGNVAIHVIGFIADAWSVAAGPITLTGTAPSFIVHLFVAIGAWYYLSQMEKRA